MMGTSGTDNSKLLESVMKANQSFKEKGIDRSFDELISVYKNRISKDVERRKQQGRNKICNCGSEKKFKWCCGKV